MKLVRLVVIAVASLGVSAYRSVMKCMAESFNDSEAENLNEAALGQLVGYNTLLAEKVKTLKQELETSNRNLAELQRGSELEETVYDKMNLKMKSVGETFLKEAGKNPDGSYTPLQMHMGVTAMTNSKFRHVVQAHDCIRSLIQMRYSEESALPGWQAIFAEVGTYNAFTQSEVIGIFQKRGRNVLDEAATRAKKSMEGITTTSGTASKSSIRAYLTKTPSEKTFLGIGNAKEGFTGWKAFFGKMGSTLGAVGKFKLDDLVKLYQQQAFDVYPGDCLA